MTSQREPYGGIVGNDALPFGGSSQERSWLMYLLVGRIDQSGLEWQRPLGSGHLPECQMPVAAQRGECPGSSQRFEIATIERRASRQVLNAVERLLAASRDEAIRTVTRKRFHEPQAQPQHRLLVVPAFQSAIPGAHTDIDRP